MHFMLDENVPVSVTEMLSDNGHTAECVLDHAPPGSPDPLVATVCEELQAILVSFDGDFQKISPRVPVAIARALENLVGFGFVAVSHKRQTGCNQP